MYESLPVNKSDISLPRNLQVHIFFPSIRLWCKDIPVGSSLSNGGACSFPLLTSKHFPVHAFSLVTCSSCNSSLVALCIVDSLRSILVYDTVKCLRQEIFTSPGVMLHLGNSALLLQLKLHRQMSLTSLHIVCLLFASPFLHTSAAGVNFCTL
jgi:hypothetical protein